MGWKRMVKAVTKPVASAVKTAGKVVLPAATAMLKYNPMTNPKLGIGLVQKGFGSLAGLAGGQTGQAAGQAGQAGAMAPMAADEGTRFSKFFRG